MSKDPLSYFNKITTTLTTTSIQPTMMRQQISLKNQPSKT